VTIAHLPVVPTRPNLCLALHRRPLPAVHSRSEAQITIINHNNNKEELVSLATQQISLLRQVSSAPRRPLRNLSSNKPGHHYSETLRTTQIHRISRQVVDSLVPAQHNSHSLSKRLHCSELSLQQQVIRPVAVYLGTRRTRMIHKTSPHYHSCTSLISTLTR